MDLLADLGWLRRAPADLRDRCKALSTHLDDPDLDTDLALVDLATYSLDGNQLDRLARLVARRRQSPTDTILARFRLGILGSGTLSLIAPAVAGSGPRHLTLIEVVEGNYDRALEDAMDPGSPVRAGALDGVLLALDYRKLGLDSAIADPKLAAEAVEAAFQYVQTIAESLRASVKGPLLVQTVVPPLEPLFGSLDAAEPGSPRAMVAALNGKLAAWVGPSSDALVDAAALANAIGLQRWHDPLQWHSAKLPFAQDLVPLYADLVARTVAALRGKTRKCLVLDLDNTLWGGVIGDDGLEGIALGNGSATGEAFLAIQRMALEYRKRGIVLAVCSKNEEDAARLPFRSHPDMVLREEHIAVFQANWTDKASNLRAIAETLNVGLDALVFLDDNPFEREQVRRELPMLAVPELPDDPALYPRALMCAGYFEAVAISAEDRKRADFYQANAVRAAALSSSSDMEAYLRSLDMVCSIRPFDHIGRARIAQLVNKSNQFNLTTRRCSEAEVAAMQADPRKFTLQIRLVDKFGDNGMISVVVFDKGAEVWSNDIWLMSCRVLGRRVEHAALAHVCAAAKVGGAKRLRGRYTPSAKNRMVADHYGKLGFACIDGNAETGSTWELDLEQYEAPDLPMRVDTGDLSQAV